MVRANNPLFYVIYSLLIVSSSLVAGCSGPEQKFNTTSTPPAQESPALFIISPAFDAGIPSGNVTVTVDVQNFQLVDPDAMKNALGEGHLIYYRDVVPPVEQGLPALTIPGTYASSQDMSYTWKNVTEGTHTFSVQLVNNDNTPLYPPVVTDNDVTVYNPNRLG